MTPTAVLIDTGPIVSIVRTSQQHHVGCVDALKSLSQPLLTCLPVITEVAYLLRYRREQVQALLQGFQAGLLQLLPIEHPDIAAVQRILQQYADQDVDFADACLFHRRTLGKARTENFWKAYRYLQSRTEHLKYHAYRQQHLPLGSGVTEAACTTIFTPRRKLSEMRWSHEGAQRILTLRTVLLSGTWEATYGLWRLLDRAQTS